MGKDKEQNESGRELESENGDVGNLLENGADMADTEVPYGKLFRKKDIDLALFTLLIAIIDCCCRL